MAQGQLSQVLGHLRRLVGPAPAGDQTDVQLLERFLTHREEAAFEALVVRYGPLVLGVCRRVLGRPEDAEDAFQATFLVLAKKARSIRKHASVGSWLYGVAYRIAVKARTQSARRRALEQAEGFREPSPDGELPGGGAHPGGLPERCARFGDPVAEAAWRETRAVLDQELRGLPGKYRDALVLCHLQGQTNEEAARALGWPPGSMSRHLTRARDLLRERLLRRGVGVSAALLGAVLTPDLTAAPLPAGLAVATTRAALGYAAVGAGAGVVSTQVIHYAEEMGRALFMTQFKTAAAWLLVAGVLAAGAGGLWSVAAPLQADGTKPAADATKMEAAARKPKPPAREGKANNAPASLAARVAQLRDKLTRPVNLEKGIDANTPLKDALEYLADHYGVQIIINHKSFQTARAEGDRVEIEMVPVRLQQMKGVRLAEVLRLLLAQADATFLVRPDGIEVTTPSRTHPEDWKGANRQGVPEVDVAFVKKPLSKALQVLADSTGINILLDPHVGAEGSNTGLTANLTNVPVDTAVRLLANMAGLKAVAIDNVLYVTTSENARELLSEQPQRELGGRAPRPGKESAGGPPKPAAKPGAASAK